MKLTLRLIAALLLLYRVSYAQNAIQGQLDQFVAKTGAVPTIDKATSSISFLRFPSGNALKINGGTAQEKALSFMSQNAGLFALRSDRDVYQVKETRRDNYGLEHVVLQQYISGVPVFDGIVKFHFNKANDLSSMNGNVIRVNKLNPIPTIKKEVAAALALKMVESQKTKDFKEKLKAPLKVVHNTLYVFQKGLAQGYEGEKHLVYEIEVRNDADVREFLYIDAHTNTLVEQFTGIHEALNRKLYTYPPGSTRFTTPTLTWSEGNQFPGDLDTWQRSEIESAGQMYHMMKNAFGYTSYDGAHAPMETSHNNPTINCPNANWDGSRANYCVGIATDDVVAHEWAHAYTEYTSGLIYLWQAGALNEAYSDIWGETVDLLNNYFDDGEGTAMRPSAGGDCPAVAITSRWRVGEKATVTNGAIRDMYNPNCFNDPGRVLDPMYYCTNPPLSNSNDYGGVHINSGVINHSYALLVDGGTYNGQTISGIGLTKAAHIFWYAQANFMTKTTDFAAQADILEASGQALIDLNRNLPNLSTLDVAPSLSGQYITPADLAELKKVLLAVEMRSDTRCGHTPMLKPVAQICDGGTAENALFFYNFESGLGNWTVSNVGSDGTWFPRNWVVKGSAPDGRPGQVVYAVDYDGGDCGADNESGVMSLMSPIMTIPAGAPTELTMAFDHYVATEGGYDGGNIKYKIGAGGWTLIPASAFIANAYNSTLTTAESSNPLAGQRAFTGSDGGSVAGSWGQSRINLTALGLDRGETIQFRWDFGTDCGWGTDGWYIDDVRIYSCSIPSVQFSTASTIVNEVEATAGIAPAVCLPYVEKIITVRINRAPTAPVTVTFNPPAAVTPSGTARLGTTADYSFSPGSFVLQASQMSQDVVVRIYNDAYVEGTETAVLSYSLSTTGDAIAGSTLQTHTLIINDDDVDPETQRVEVLNADFNDKVFPSGWLSDNDNNGIHGEYPQDWAVIYGEDPNVIYLDPNVAGQPFLIADSDHYGSGVRTWSVETPPFSTLGMKSINLSFLEVFRTYAQPGDFDEVASIDVWDGTAWRSVFTQNEASGTSGTIGAAVTRNITIPDAYANAAMKLRFQYTASFDWYWALDNIKVTATYPKQIETAVTTNPDAQYLGPRETAYFYDPGTGNLIAKIENLTDWDYGCTTVQIDRTGTGSESWVASYTITRKTFKVTPSNPNPNGSYKITLYYKDAELGAYKGSIASMGKSENGITTGNQGAGSFAEVQISSAYETDWAYTATFNSGFSGFGLSNAPAIGSLPVKLVKFDGKHTTEGNLLKWATTSEVNSDYFAVERATEVKSFVEIGRVNGNGNSAITNNYQFKDSKYGKGLNYYRLKSVDQDGSFAYSKIVAIEAANAREIKAFPNPVQATLHIELPDVNISPVRVKIINASGQVVLEKDKVKTTGGVLVQDVSKLGAGLYQVVISDENTGYNFQMVKL
ncbi:hypothetical protein DSL64_10560 [Dyadobacter luteus]|uniref:Bacillolysin n=1 Tax=Dyadobacter luteus TaxID=2259619 RepID=A0A3D8YDB3_9BACT|nr:M4 family metallopeptidase [Dyadobacter luteus]REA62088.1 hypothetical protein DSL64_10560 [Dyadobacter luteus]